MVLLYVMTAALCDYMLTHTTWEGSLFSFASPIYPCLDPFKGGPLSSISIADAFQTLSLYFYTSGSMNIPT
jgi:hypothetical protein